MSKINYRGVKRVEPYSKNLLVLKIHKKNKKG